LSASLIKRLLPATLYVRLRNGIKGAPNPHLSRAFLLGRSVKRRQVEGSWSFRSLEDLTLATQQLAERLPNQYDLLVGVPRSGLLPASLLALKFGRPLAIAGLPADIAPWLSATSERKLGEPRKILVIDDSAKTAASVLEAAAETQQRWPEAVVDTAVIFAAPESEHLVTYCQEVLLHPRMFEWNLMHSKQGKLATDMDGVLCENCPSGVSDDESRYVEWMKTAKPHLIPGFTIDAIITNRFERHRALTEAWLKAHGVRYDQLLMSPARDKSEAEGRQVEYKLANLLQVKPDIFWESAEFEALGVWQKTRIPTLCTDEMIFWS
jgi:hypoxanthine phosphoribosyltransferase